MSDLIPRWPLRLLKWFCPEHLLEEIEGDLLQKLARDLESPGHSKWPRDYKSDGYWRRRSDGYRLRRAKRRLIWNVIRFCRPGIVMRNKFSFELNQFGMLKSYFKMGYRQLMKSKVFSLINVLGLSIGMVAFFLII